MVIKKTMPLICFLAAAINLWGQSIPSYSITVSGPSSAGYYFCSPIKTGAGSGSFPPMHLILDHNGDAVYYKFFSGNNTGDFKIQPNGSITYNRLGKFYIMDSTFTIKDSVVVKNGFLFDGHDFQILPDGHFLLLGAETITMDLSSYHLFNGTNPGSSTATVKCGVIQEQDANKNVVFEWRCKDHFSFTDVDPLWLTNPNNVDWTHLNAVEQDLDGNFLLSVRHFNEITKIKRSDSSIIWRLGGNANQFSFTNDPNRFKAQHDIRRIANGHLTLFDNGSASPPHPCSAKEYLIDETASSAVLVWNYTENPNTFSRALGNVQRLPNGNTLVNYGMLNNLNQAFHVVTPNGTKAFEVVFSDTLRSYRAFNYQSLPWNLKRPVISCYSLGGQTYLDAGTGYNSYLWSNGATTQTIAITNTGSYFVWVPKGQGGFISSEKHVVSDLNNPCLNVSIQELNKAGLFTVFPNPFTNSMTIGLDDLRHSLVNIELYDLLGEKLYSASLKSHQIIPIQMDGLKRGIYFLKVNNQIQKVIKQ